MGGKHATFNMALWDRDFAASASEADMAALMAGIAQHSNVDVLALYQQPLTWRDVPNPMALLPHQPSANDCPLLVMEPGAASLLVDLELVPAAVEGQGAQAAAHAAHLYRH